jgi:hypothetical protein
MKKNKLQEIEEYFETAAMSQSLLLRYSNHPRYFEREKKKQKRKERELYYEEKQHFLDGSAVDVLLTMPEHFEDLYYIDKLEIKPSDIVMSIIKYLADHNISIDDTETIREVANQHSYGQKWSDEVLQSRIINGGTSGKGLVENLGRIYYSHLEKSRGKEIISKEEESRIQACVNGFKNHPNTAWIWNNTDPEIEILFQVPIYSKLTHRGYDLPTKGLIDILVINHSKKEKVVSEAFKLSPNTVLEIDIKTTSGYLDNYDFDIKKRRYDIQRAWYKRLITSKYIPSNKLFFTVPSLPKPFMYGYSSPCIIVNSFVEPDYPKVYKFSYDDMHFASMGRNVYSSGTILDEEGEKTTMEILFNYKNPIIGIHQLLDRYVYFEENGYIWEERENNGVETTNLWHVQS